MHTDIISSSNRFEESCSQAMLQECRQTSIGTYGEKSVHAALKRYFQPDSSFHEQPVAGFIADVCFGDEIYEIQTAHFYKLPKKLDAFLGEYQVTVVYPIPYEKWICWTDPDTGEIAERRKSPKKGRVQYIFPELYRLRSYLHHPRLHFCIMLMDMEECRLLDGYGENRKRRGTKCDRIPSKLRQQLWLRQPSDYRQLLPEGLPEEFTAKEFARAAGIPIKSAQTGLLLLTELGIVKRMGKAGRSYLYSVI